MKNRLRVGVFVLVMGLILGLVAMPGCAGSLLSNPKFQAFDANGDPLSGGKLYTYAAGTTTNQETFSEYTLTTGNTNPVILDTRGEADVFLDGSYKLILKTSGDVTVWTIDNIRAVGVLTTEFTETLLDDTTAADARVTLGIAAGAQSYIIDATEPDQGVSGSGRSVYDIIAEVGTDKAATMSFSHTGAGNYTTYTFSTDETIPANIAIEIEKGAILDLDGAITDLTINGPFDPGLYQVFSGAGTVTFGKGAVKKLYPQWWGAYSDGTHATETTAAITAAAYCATENADTLFFPVGAYRVNTVTLDSFTNLDWITLNWEGEDHATGQGLSQSYIGLLESTGTTFITDGTTAISITMDNYYNETIKIKNMSFIQIGTRGTTAAIEIIKTAASGNFPRGWEFHNLGFYDFQDAIRITAPGSGHPAAWYIGQITFKNITPFYCDAGLRLTGGYFDLISVNDSVFHSMVDGGIVIDGGGVLMSLKNAHFEGCEVAGIVSGEYVSTFVLDSVSAEGTGTVSGYGFFKRNPAASRNLTKIQVLGRSYGFTVMPDEFRLGGGDTIDSVVPVKASGYGWITNTPDMVTPVVSNNATYGQVGAMADKSVFCMTPVHSNIGRKGTRMFDRFTGYAATVNYACPYSGDLPDAIRANFIGTKASLAGPMANETETYIPVPSGYGYLSWIAADANALNGFTAATVVAVDAANVVQAYGFVPGWTAGAYNFLFMFPLATAEVVTTVSMVMQSVPTWMTGGYLTFETALLTMQEAACGYPKLNTTVKTVADAATETFFDLTDGSTAYMLRLRLMLRDSTSGAQGFFEYLIDGDGIGTATRTYTSLVATALAGVTVSTADAGLGASMYNITVANATGNDIVVTIQIEYLQ